MPSWFPVSGITSQRVLSSGLPASGYVLKLYRAGTSTNIPLATDSTGGTQANYAVANAVGDWTVSGNVIIPHINEDYKLAIYPTQAAADADSGATVTVDNLSFFMFGVTATASELNKLAGTPAGLTSTEIGYLDGVTSAIQTQLDTKAIGVALAVDSEMVLFDGTGGKQLKRSATTGILRATSGVVGAALSGTDIKTVNSTTLLGSGNINAGWVYLSTVSASAAATVDVETGFSATYDNYVIVANGVTLNALGTLRVRWKIGGSYLTTSTYYDVVANGAEETSAKDHLTTFGADTLTAGGLVHYLFSANSSAAKTGHLSGQMLTNTPGILFANRGYANSNTGALSGARFYSDGGELITGTFRLYAIPNS